MNGTALSLINDTFEEGAPRARAIAIYAGAAGGGGAVGLILGGLITNYDPHRALNVTEPARLERLKLCAVSVGWSDRGRSGR